MRSLAAVSPAAASPAPPAPAPPAAEACIPTIGMADTLPLIIRLLRLQSVPLHIRIIDTGSPPEELAAILALEAPDVEVHCLRARRWPHPSDPVAVALDLAMSLCLSERLLLTHADCFPRRRDAAERLLRLVDADAPVAGYRITPRRSGLDWARWAGHTWTAIHVPACLRAGLRWCHAAHRAADGGLARSDWDTEYHFMSQAICRGLPVRLTGEEENYQRNVTEDFDHVRSLPSARLYSPAHRERAEVWLVEALREGEARAREWESRSVAQGEGESPPKPKPS